MASENHRLFIALPLPGQVTDYLLAFKRLFPNLKFAVNFHLTLRFIGEAQDVDIFRAALASIKTDSFELRLTRLGMFGHRVFWAGVEESEGLRGLKSAVDLALIKAGLTPEARYSPHITLARLRQKAIAAEMLAQASKLKLDHAWVVDEFRLYRSILRQEGAIHETLETYGLKTSSSQSNSL